MRSQMLLTLIIVFWIDSQIPAKAEPLMLVSSYLNNTITAYEPSTGAFVKTLVPHVDGFGTLGELIVGPDQDVYASDYSGNRVLRFDGDTGAIVRTYARTNLQPRGIALAADGSLLVTSTSRNEILRYDADTGALHGVFAKTCAAPIGMTFGPDGNLYVSMSTPANRVERFHGQTGVSLGVFADTNLDNPNSLLFGPDGKLYVCSQYDYRIVRFDGQTGVFDQVFVQMTYPFNPAAGMLFGLDGNFYTTNLASGNIDDGVLRFDGQTGTYLGEFVDGGGNYMSTGLALQGIAISLPPLSQSESPPPSVCTPEPGTRVLLVLGGTAICVFGAVRRRCRDQFDHS